MSGIVGILNLDGAPVDRVLLGRMTDFMTFRGPDAQKIWVNGNVGFGHTLLKTTFESEHEHQPFTLDGQVWIVADARVDAQDDLIAKLSRTRDLVACRKGETTDVELILRAYHAWGEDCVDHLLGDFAFAIWDDPRQRLFCARDHMGVKPFYYAHIGRTVIFSNTLDCIRQHPAVSDTLNDLAIADFLLFDLNQDPETTSFADIQRIPPAHRATWSRDGLKTSRYWTLPIDEPVYFKRADDYTDRFRELLDTAVSDRLRANKVGVFMSGGLDSSSLAATACEIFTKNHCGSAVRAFTDAFAGFDDERHYARLVAEHLEIPVEIREGTCRTSYPPWHLASLHTPEPIHNPLNLGPDFDLYRRVSLHSHIVFHGEGPDNALAFEWRSYSKSLLRQGRIGRLVGEVATHAVLHKRIPLLQGIPRQLASRWHRTRQNFPGWLNPDFERELGLRERWSDIPASRSSSHPVHPIAHASFSFPHWQTMFEQQDAGATMAPLEMRHPFLDLRLLRYMLAVPVLPWCRRKLLLRRAMKSTLPRSVLHRPKSSMTMKDPWFAKTLVSGLPIFTPTPEVIRYVSPELVARRPDQVSTAFWTNFRPHSLNYWLRNLSVKREVKKEDNQDEPVRREVHAH